MNIPFLGNWRKRHGADGAGGAVAVHGAAGKDDRAVGAGAEELLAECELLRARASAAGIELDDTPESLEALDQLLPRWRDDPEELPRLGNDAGLYLGTVVVRTVPGASWHIRPGGGPVLRLPSGREVNVVETGQDWAVSGAPELSQVYAGVHAY